VYSKVIRGRSPDTNIVDESMEEGIQPSLTSIAKELNSGDQNKYYAGNFSIILLFIDVYGLFIQILGPAFRK